MVAMRSQISQTENIMTDQALCWDITKLLSYETKLTFFEPKLDLNIVNACMRVDAVMQDSIMFTPWCHDVIQFSTHPKYSSPMKSILDSLETNSSVICSYVFCFLEIHLMIHRLYIFLKMSSSLSTHVSPL